MPQFGTLGAQELAPRRYVVEQLAHFHGGAGCMRTGRHFADLAAFDLQCRTVFVMCATRGQGKAADRGDRRQRFATEPSVATDSRSSRSAILLVAWRETASGSCSGAMPLPLSRMRIRRTPPSSRSISTRLAPASIAFSTSSLTTDAGRSTTSPAAIWLIRIPATAGSGAVRARSWERMGSRLHGLMIAEAAHVESTVSRLPSAGRRKPRAARVVD